MLLDQYEENEPTRCIHVVAGLSPDESDGTAQPWSHLRGSFGEIGLASNHDAACSRFSIHAVNQ